MDEKCVHDIDKMDCEACWNLSEAVENRGIANLLRQTGMEKLRVVQQARWRNLLFAAILSRLVLPDE